MRLDVLCGWHEVSVGEICPLARCEVLVGVTGVPIGSGFIAVGTKYPLVRCSCWRNVPGGRMFPLERCEVPVGVVDVAVGPDV